MIRKADLMMLAYLFPQYNNRILIQRNTSRCTILGLIQPSCASIITAFVLWFLQVSYQIRPNPSQAPYNAARRQPMRKQGKVVAELGSKGSSRGMGYTSPPAHALSDLLRYVVQILPPAAMRFPVPPIPHPRCWARY